MVLPQGILRAASGGPALVELKNGDSYSGVLAAVDNLMNIRLEDAVYIQRSEYRFERMTECVIRGQFVKFVRFPEDLLDRILEQETMSLMGSSRSSRWRGRGRGGQKGKGRGSDSGATTCLPVPSSLVGMIIGRGGETVKRLAAESGARIEVAKEQAEGSEERDIYITGTPECVEEAREMIAALTSSRTGQRERQKGDRQQYNRSDRQRPPVRDHRSGKGKQ